MFLLNYFVIILLSPLYLFNQKVTNIFISFYFVFIERRVHFDYINPYDNTQSWRWWWWWWWTCYHRCFHMLVPKKIFIKFSSANTFTRENFLTYTDRFFPLLSLMTAMMMINFLFFIQSSWGWVGRMSSQHTFAVMLSSWVIKIICVCAL
jgi:hypothetical protein